MSCVSQTAQPLISKTDRIRESIETGDWDKARDHIREFSTFWHDAKSVWTILLNHKEIDSIDMSLAKMEQYIAARETGLALGEISVLNLLIKHIPDKEKLSLKNIF